MLPDRHKGQPDVMLGAPGPLPSVDGFKTVAHGGPAKALNRHPSSRKSLYSVLVTLSDGRRELVNLEDLAHCSAS